MSDERAAVRLVCPLCGTDVEPRPGRCSGCGARYGGDADGPPEAVAAFLAEVGAGDLDAEPLSRALFVLGTDDPRAGRMAITSDRRDGYYRWWVFVQAGEADPAGVLAEALAAT